MDNGCTTRDTNEEIQTPRRGLHSADAVERRATRVEHAPAMEELGNSFYNISSDDEQLRTRRARREETRRHRRRSYSNERYSSGGYSPKHKASKRHYGQRSYSRQSHRHSTTSSSSESLGRERRYRGENRGHSRRMKHAKFGEEYLESRGSRGRVFLDVDGDEARQRSEWAPSRRGRSPSPYTPPRVRRQLSNDLTGYNAGGHLKGDGVGSIEAANEEPSGSARPRGHRIFNSMQLKKESALRMERRDREAKREISIKRRVESGQRPHYVHVNEDGKSYGLGISVWNDALCKCVRGLDPLYIDIRHQPFHLMETLMQRLNDDFEYSNDVNSRWLRTCIGNALSSYRHELMKLIQSNHDCPKWVDKSVWDKLIKIANSEKFQAKSEQMRYANSCRKTKGRTGPLGEAGVAERLRQVLGRTPMPEEVQEEMLRDKGYSGRAKRRQVFVDTKMTSEIAASIDNNVTSNCQELVLMDMDGGTKKSDEVETMNVERVQQDRTHVPLTTTQEGDPTFDSPLVVLLCKQVEELRSSAIGFTTEGRHVMQALQNQVQEVRSRILHGNSPLFDTLEGPAEESSLLEECSPAPVDPSPISIHAGIRVDVPVEAVLEKTTLPSAIAVRKSGRVPKKILRD